jgi:hypothetical protein
MDSAVERRAAIILPRSSRPIRAADESNGSADGTWPNLTGHVKPHDYRHAHATVLDNSDVKKVLAMDRRGHAMPGMDAVYVHVTDDMRQHLCDVLEELWRSGSQSVTRLPPLGGPDPGRDPALPCTGEQRLAGVLTLTTQRGPFP